MFPPPSPASPSSCLAAVAVVEAVSTTSDGGRGVVLPLAEVAAAVVVLRRASESKLESHIWQLIQNKMGNPSNGTSTKKWF